MFRLPASLLLAASTLAPLHAQAPSSLVGLTVNGAVRTSAPVACQVFGQCLPPGFPVAVGVGGGTAWDPVHQGAWISNGNVLACVGDTCNYLCPPIGLGGLGGAVVTGLEVLTGAGRLWAIDSSDTLHVLDLACPPVPLGSCQVAFVNPFVTGGLAVDELNGIVFYARFDPALGQNYIVTASVAAPCTPLALLPVFQCAPALGALRGLAVDSVARVLHATDGDRTLRIPYLLVPGSLASLGPTICCPAPGGAFGPMVGLALRPGQPTFTGSTCNSGSCPPCPMVQDVNSDPVLGNVGFGVRLQGAPAGSLVWCAIGDGPCAPLGVVIPPLCGPMHTLNLLGLLGPGLVGGAGCGGTVDVPLPLPMNPALGGLVYSSQFFVLCLNNPLGAAQSQCLSFEVQGL
jgi:hypothetical protein